MNTLAKYQTAMIQMWEKSSTFAPWQIKTTPSSIYESLAGMILPDGILELFEVTRVEDEYTGIIEETGLERRIPHIELRERDLREKVWFI